jgi:hypothetical protein
MNLAFILCISLVCLGLAGAFISGWDDEDDDWGNERKATTAIQRFANKVSHLTLISINMKLSQTNSIRKNS